MRDTQEIFYSLSQGVINEDNFEEKKPSYKRVVIRDECIS
jgi:hypothetical protein